MKKYSISFEYDEERIKALKKYLEVKETTLETEILRAVDSLYSKTVPVGVREYIALMSGMEPTPKKPAAIHAKGQSTASNVVGGKQSMTETPGTDAIDDHSIGLEAHGGDPQ